MRARFLVLIVSLGIGFTLSISPTAIASGNVSQDPTPLYAYYYIWFTPSSWNRAKVDYPTLGRYSSDEQTIMREHIRLAKSAGINGFIVSWKSTPTLNKRLTKLAAVARSEDFRLTIIYQGLDFERRPLPVSRIKADIGFFIDQYGQDSVFEGFSKPVLIWSGTWMFSADEIEQATAERRSEIKLLATERTTDNYLDKASLFDGNAYYWASVNPETFPSYPEKLREMGEAVHDKGGLWFAPAAPGFDARLVGGESVVPRNGDETLRRELDVAQQSAPDALGLISWNEFSENTHVEPSTELGTKALEAVADFRGAKLQYEGDFDSSAPAGRREGFASIQALFGVTGLLAGGAFVLAVVWRAGRRKGREPR